jgi:hypothetical protein
MITLTKMLDDLLIPRRLGYGHVAAAAYLSKSD